MVITPSGRQEVGHAGDEVVELRHLRQNVVGGDQVRVAMLGDDLSCGFGAEERRQRGDAAGASRFRHVGGGLDTKHPLTELEKMLQEVAVVAAELDDEAVRPEDRAAPSSSRNSAWRVPPSSSSRTRNRHIR